VACTGVPAVIIWRAREPGLRGGTPPDRQHLAA